MQQFADDQRRSEQIRKRLLPRNFAVSALHTFSTVDRMFLHCSRTSLTSRGNGHWAAFMALSSYVLAGCTCCGAIVVFTPARLDGGLLEAHLYGAFRQSSRFCREPLLGLARRPQHQFPELDGGLLSLPLQLPVRVAKSGGARMS